jgi:hypothetical protein
MSLAWKETCPMEEQGIARRHTFVKAPAPAQPWQPDRGLLPL